MALFLAWSLEAATWLRYAVTGTVLLAVGLRYGLAVRRRRRLKRQRETQILTQTANIPKVDEGGWK